MRILDTAARYLVITIVKLYADKRPSSSCARDARSPAAHEWVEDGSAFGAYIAYKLFKQLDWLFVWMNELVAAYLHMGENISRTLRRELEPVFSGKDNRLVRWAERLAKIAHAYALLIPYNDVAHGQSGKLDGPDERILNVPSRKTRKAPVFLQSACHERQPPDIRHLVIRDPVEFAPRLTLLASAVEVDSIRRVGYARRDGIIWERPPPSILRQSALNILALPITSASTMAPPSYMKKAHRAAGDSPN